VLDGLRGEDSIAELCRKDGISQGGIVPFRRRERGMTRFRRPATFQKFVSTHASVYNHFNHQRHIEGRTRFKVMRDVSLIEWRELVVA
jgi:putative transposase